MQSGRHSGSLQEGRSKHWPCRKPTQRPAWPAGDQAWFNSRIFAGDKSGVAGVELATASEPPSAPASDLGASPLGRRPQPPLSCDLRLNHALSRGAVRAYCPRRNSSCSPPIRRGPGFSSGFSQSRRCSPQWSGDPARTSAINPRGKKTYVNRNFAAAQVPAREANLSISDPPCRGRPSRPLPDRVFHAGASSLAQRLGSPAPGTPLTSSTTLPRAAVALSMAATVRSIGDLS